MPRRPEARLLLTCEHGGCRVPPAWRPLFAGRARTVRSHRGWDPGALEVARSLARRLGAPLVATTVTRLLVDPNRSAHNPRVFSDFTRSLPLAQRRALLTRHHTRHWQRVRAALDGCREPALHVAVHSFTPELRGDVRSFAIGLLYDPKRARERRLALAWQRALQAALGRSQVRRNAPYRGAADGLTTALRRERPGARYLGLELELNQAALADPSRRRRLVDLLVATWPDEI